MAASDITATLVEDGGLRAVRADGGDMNPKPDTQADCRYRCSQEGGVMSVRQRVERIQDEIEGVAAQYGVTSWEREFLESVSERATLSEKQETILSRIEEKVFG